MDDDSRHPTAPSCLVRSGSPDPLWPLVTVLARIAEAVDRATGGTDAIDGTGTYEQAEPTSSKVPASDRGEGA